MPVDVAIVGGGLIGLATALELQRQFPDRTVAVLEKELAVAQHQSGRNSGVLHSGIYYKPGSIKARTCRDGQRAMQEFCAAHGIPYELCGKVIVAVDQRELPALQRIHQRGLANGVRCELIGPERLKEIEPHAAGCRALHVPEAGIVDFRAVAACMARQITAAGNSVLTGFRVRTIRRLPAEIALADNRGREIVCRWLINCAGLYCDHVARRAGMTPAARIVPFRGEYYELAPARAHLCRHLIYPVPDPNFPFLGVHFTRRIGGGIECGPNAVLAAAREGYRWRDVRLREMAETLGYAGFRRLVARHWRMGLGEVVRSLSKRAFVRALQRLVPDIRARDLHSAPAGVRAQAVLPDGTLVDDFLILEDDRVISVNNAPSPAATASLSIGRTIVERLAPWFNE